MSLAAVLVAVWFGWETPLHRVRAALSPHTQEWSQPEFILKKQHRMNASIRFKNHTWDITY